jgi:hypothetical protein
MKTKETSIKLDSFGEYKGANECRHPPSPDTSQAILAAFAERGIRFVKDSLVKALDPGRKLAVLSDGSEMPYELFLGVPVHRVPQVVVESGLAAGAYGWVPVNKKTLETTFPAGGASTALNNLGTTEINASLLPNGIQPRWSDSADKTLLWSVIAGAGIRLRCLVSTSPNPRATSKQ